MYSRYKDGTLTVDHVNDFLGIIKELANLGIEFDDEVNGLILLNTLPESWESFRSTTINSSLDDTQAPVTENRGRSKTREPRGQGGRSRSKSKSRVKCDHCGQPGHMKRNCNLLKGKNKKEVDDSNTIAIASTSGDDVTLVCDRGECCQVENSDAEWIIDSALDEEGYAHYFGNGNWKLIKGSMVVAKGRACCSLYKTHMKMCGGQLNIVEDDASPNLWHKRLTRMSEKGSQLLAKESFIPIAKDNRGEYTSKEFKDYYSKHGIRHEKIVPDTPQHNGVAKRMNHTIVEKIISGEEVQVSKDETEEPTIEEDEVSVNRGSNKQGEQPLPQEEGPQLRRSTRKHKSSARYISSDYILITKEGEPKNFQEVQSYKDKNGWMKAMQEEMNSLHKNNTYELVTLPKGRKPLKNKWVFKLKKDGDKIVRYKARLVVKGFSKKKGIDFDEIFPQW
ncbi:hypothetical protein SLEP1_g25638 [Rubroshorea leprosula]|uniref:Uncharacterized protein n=1 Tax=Rubroshorea leprosula TaxID=152421 RepID=A0AAV5JJV4_9ROSI|nr:hypothetical protein SLEP1_g25638 [Rubroshorea leprosula]